MTFLTPYVTACGPMGFRSDVSKRNKDSQWIFSQKNHSGFFWRGWRAGAISYQRIFGVVVRNMEEPSSLCNSCSVFIGVWLTFFRFQNVSAVWNPSFSCFLIIMWLVERVPELEPGGEADIIWRHPPSLLASEAHPDSPTGMSRGSDMYDGSQWSPNPGIPIFM